MRKDPVRLIWFYSFTGKLVLRSSKIVGYYNDAKGGAHGFVSTS